MNSGTESSAGPPVSGSIHSAMPSSDSASCSDSPGSTPDSLVCMSVSASARVGNGPYCSAPSFQ